MKSRDAIDRDPGRGPGLDLRFMTPPGRSLNRAYVTFAPAGRDPISRMPMRHIEPSCVDQKRRDYPWGNMNGLNAGFDDRSADSLPFRSRRFSAPRCGRGESLCPGKVPDPAACRRSSDATGGPSFASGSRVSRVLVAISRATSGEGDALARFDPGTRGDRRSRRLRTLRRQTRGAVCLSRRDRQTRSPGSPVTRAGRSCRAGPFPSRPGAS